MDVDHLMELLFSKSCSRRFISITLCFIVLSNFAVAKDVELPASVNSTEWKLRDQAAQKALDEKTQSASRPIQLPNVSPFDASFKESVCFSIKDVHIEGFYGKLATTQGHRLIGRCLGQKGIQSFVRFINQKLLHDGYVTSRATLPEQNIATGILTIKITKGLVEKIVFPEGYRFHWESALPLQPGDVLNLRDMEQGLEQINRLQSQDITFKIEPGSYDGESIIVVQVKQSKPWTVNLSVDDSGSDTTGKYPASAGFSVDNLLGIEDAFSYSESYARKGAIGESNSQSVSLDIPLGFYTVGLSSSKFDYQQLAIGSVRNFVLSGNGQDDKYRLDHVLFRNNVIKAGWFGAVKKRQRRSFIDDTEIQVQRRNLTELELGASYRQYIQASAFDLSISVHQGVPWFQADNVDHSATSDSAQPNYRFYSLTASFNTPLSFAQTRLNYSSQFWWQYAQTALYSIDWFNNGGRYTVRGFSSSESLSAENGWRSRNELLIPVSLLGYQTTSYIGLDTGQVSGPGSEDESSKTLMGLSVGLKGQASYFHYDAFVSEPFLAHGPYAKSNDYKVNASLSMNF